MNLSRLFVPGLSMIFIGGMIIAGISSCRHQDDMSLITTDVCFDIDILPIFQTGCAISGCHDGSVERLNLDSYSGIMEGVQPGDANKSKVYTVLSNVWSIESMMPPDRPLSLENRTKIKIWIEKGAKSTCP
jgi:hypothetical protein